MTLVGRHHLATFGKEELDKHRRYAKKYFNKNLAKLKLGTPRQVVFAASHLKSNRTSLRYVKLRDYHMIPRAL